MLKRCFREPIGQIYDATRYLDAAVSAHLNGNGALAEELIRYADNAQIRDWLESIWGRASPYVVVKKKPQLHALSKEKDRMPSAQQRREVLLRDGYHCRFCGLPVIRAEVRKYLARCYPDSLSWGRTNQSQHAAFQCMWLQYDHVVPHSVGGANTIDNIVVACAGCNYGKWNYALEELGLLDPREVPPVKSGWDGLERVLQE